MKSKLHYILLIIFLFIFTACSTPVEESTQVVDDTSKIISEDTSDKSKDESKKIIIASMENKPFKTIVDGQLAGPFVDIITQALDNIGYEYELEIIPWSRLVESVQNGSVDIGFSFFDTPKRRKFANYMEEPLSIYSMKLFSMPDSNIEFDGTLKSIDDYSIGLVQDYFYTNEITDAIANNTIKVDQANDGPTNIEKLINGRVDLIIEDNVAVNEYLRSNNIDIELKEFEIPIVYNYTYLVFPKDKDHDHLRKELDLQFKSMKANGSFYDYYREYNLDYYADTFESLESTNPPKKKYFVGYNDDPLSIGVIADTKPYVYKENGKLTGFIIDFLSESLDRVGANYKFVEMPFSRILEELETGSLDIGTDIYYNESRAEYLLYDSNPFIAYPTVLFTNSNSNLNFTGSLDELKTYKIGYVRDYYLGPLEEHKNSSDFKFFMADTNKSNFDNLINGRIDIAIDIKSTGENIIENLNLSDDIGSIAPPLFSEYSYIVFSKKNGFEVLLSEYEYAVQSMRDDGTLEKLYNKYNLDYFDLNNN